MAHTVCHEDCQQVCGKAYAVLHGRAILDTVTVSFETYHRLMQ